jgi:hypothetical protein
MRASNGIARVVRVSVALIALHHAHDACADEPASSSPDKLACIAADTDGQASRLKGEFRSARARFAMCASPACPKIVRDDCFDRIVELAKAQPEVVFEATNGNGQFLHMVSVFVDDQLVAERLDGRAIKVDPGEHRFTFRALGRLDAELRLSVPEGARTRRAVVLRTLGEARAVVEPPSQPPESAELPVTLSPRSVGAGARPQQPTPAQPRAGETPAFLDPGSAYGRMEIGAVGMGALGVALGTIFGLLTVSKWSEARADCAHEPCLDTPQTERGQREASAASVDGDISTVAFVAGGAALAAGALLWLTDPARSDRAAGLRIVPSAGSNRGQIALQSRF